MNNTILQQHFNQDISIDIKKDSVGMMSLAGITETDQSASNESSLDRPRSPGFKRHFVFKCGA